jgi:hypothetical protein
MDKVVAVAVVCLIVGYSIRKFPALLSIGFIVLALYAIQIGSHGEFPLLNDLVNGIEILVNQRGMRL